MKLFVFALLTVSILGMSSAFPTCTNTNPYIKLMSYWITLLPTPYYTSSICSNEFSQYGTCCDPFVLIDYATLDSINVTSAVKRVNDEYARFAGVLPAIMKLLVQIASAPNSGNLGLDLKIAAAKLFIQSPQVKAYYTAYSFIGVQDATELATQNTKCWNAYMQARNASICYSCSGRADDFFANGAAVVSMAQCSQLMAICEPAISKLVMFSKILQDMETIGNMVTKFGVLVNTADKMMPGAPKSFFAEYVTQGLPETLHQYETNPTNNAASAVTLCTKFLKLRNTPFISDFAAIFKSTGAAWNIQLDASLYNHVNANLATINPKVSAYLASLATTSTTSKWTMILSNLKNGYRRMLAVAASGVGSDSVIYNPTNGQYSSYIGAPGTGSQSAATAPSAMDLASAFP